MTLEANKTSPQSPQDKDILFNCEPRILSKNKLYSKAYLNTMHNYFTKELPSFEVMQSETTAINLIRYNH